MKDLQIVFLKIILYSILFFSQSLCYAQNEKIKQADSLFKAKQYTQSLELYQSVFNDKKYTPAMLLRMAYINEGLGKVGTTLYFLTLYHLATGDEHALKKTEELAAKFKLTGYEEDNSNTFNRGITKNLIWIQAALTFVLLIIAMVIFIQRRQSRRPWELVTALILVIGLLFYSTNFYSSESGIVTSDKAYLMDGPSAGANVVSIINEGTLLKLLGSEDVWIRVKWTDKEVYLKEKSILKVAL
jgi:hypothetical protein